LFANKSDMGEPGRTHAQWNTEDNWQTYCGQLGGLEKEGRCHNVSPYLGVPPYADKIDKLTRCYKRGYLFCNNTWISDKSNAYCTVEEQPTTTTAPNTSLATTIDTADTKTTAAAPAVPPTTTPSAGGSNTQRNSGNSTVPPTQGQRGTARHKNHGGTANQTTRGNPVNNAAVGTKQDQAANGNNTPPSGANNGDGNITGDDDSGGGSGAILGTLIDIGVALCVVVVVVGVCRRKSLNDARSPTPRRLSAPSSTSATCCTNP
jgi:hypothetical protein